MLLHFRPLCQNPNSWICDSAFATPFKIPSYSLNWEIFFSWRALAMETLPCFSPWNCMMILYGTLSIEIPNSIGTPPSLFMMRASYINSSFTLFWASSVFFSSTRSQMELFHCHFHATIYSKVAGSKATTSQELLRSN